MREARKLSYVGRRMAHNQLRRTWHAWTVAFHQRELERNHEFLMREFAEEKEEAARAERDRMGVVDQVLQKSAEKLMDGLKQKAFSAWPVSHTLRFFS